MASATQETAATHLSGPEPAASETGGPRLSGALVFVLSFMVLDSMLSMAFLCWPVLSPNYFHVVDRRVWQLNWSPLAKAANTAGVVGALALELFPVAFAVAVVVLGIKLWSARRVIRLLAAEGR